VVVLRPVELVVDVVLRNRVDVEREVNRQDARPRGCVGRGDEHESHGQRAEKCPQNAPFHDCKDFSKVTRSGLAPQSGLCHSRERVARA
jgi:hypothetical protein